ncbi:hypothetical protein ACFU76_37215 [Streptomyces sp. NPDC057539]|uniref:hypothetical protein n=1 Tax=Streptomyces sp. NPDC057539 TaxID=3346159 RepID=UPI003675FD18
MNQTSILPTGTVRFSRNQDSSFEGFGALAGRDIVYLRRPWDHEDAEPVVYLMEIGPDGRRIRQVELAEDGTALRGGPDDWPLNPPVVDLFDPAPAAGQEISRREFEDQWASAQQVDPDV